MPSRPSTDVRHEGASGRPDGLLGGGDAKREQNLPEIGRTFQRMTEANVHDATRPSIEFYRSQREVVLFLPVK